MFGCYGAAAPGGEDPIADIGCALFLFGLFGGPSFHGSLKPRPNTDPWSENSGISYGPDIAGALGLPDEQCDFGACGSNALSPVGNLSTFLPQLPFNEQVDVPFWWWWQHQTTKPHGLWTYGNWCGTGGAGWPIDQHDTICMMHDYCYYSHGFTAADNFDLLSPDRRSQLQSCNQQLCNAEGKLGGWTADQIRSYFYFAPDNGNGCR